MGLLDTWQEWKNDYGIKKPDHEKPGYYEQKQKDLEEKYKTFPVAGGKVDMTINKKSQELVGASQPNQITSANINQMQNKNITPFNPSQGGDQQGASVNEDMGFMSRLANMAGVDMKEATANWKDKGGFEGLMSNPGFTLGLALMQSSAQGKTIGAGVLDNFVKAAGISAQFKDRMDARKEAPIEATSNDVAEVKSLLSSMNISDPSNLEKFFGKVTGKGNVQLKFDMASEDIAIELQKEIKRLKKNKKPGEPEVVYDTNMKFKILKRMLDSGKFKKKGGTWFTDATLESQTKVPLMARGGPVAKGKPYVVGERGPEYFLPKESGKIVSNDDSRIFAMLLAANPQLQQVSKTRAERIIRSRFPEYFD
tara:strand:+ start:1973 stop:3073 length:1101 start_codon:yes stop_codon:yes gene_type:complete